jgi:hypothetical protein
MITDSRSSSESRAPSGSRSYNVIGTCASITSCSFSASSTRTAATRLFSRGRTSTRVVAAGHAASVPAPRWSLPASSSSRTYVTPSVASVSTFRSLACPPRSSK